MVRRRVQGVVCILAVLFLMPWSAAAEKVNSVDAANRLAQAFGGKDQPGLIDNALRSVTKYQRSRYKREVTFEKTLDFRVLGERYAAVGFDAMFKKAGSARAKGQPAIYVLLFLKEAGKGLDHQMQHLLILAEPKDVASYGTMTDVQLTTLFRNAGVEAKVAVQPKAKKTKPVAVQAPAFSGSNIKKGVVGETFIDESITRDSELRQLLSGYAKKSDIPKMMPVMKAGAGSPQLQMRVAALEAQVRALEALLTNITRKGGNIYFNGVNLYVTNGTGQTDKVNGKGNLIIGYGSTGKGSHNLVVGTGNQYQGSGGLVMGQGNVLEGDNGVALGGTQNRVSGDNSVVVGGKANSASGTYATILGGSENNAKGEFASINGQRGRTKGGKNPHFSSQKTNE